MTSSISRRVASLKPSVTVAITNRAKQMRADGVDVLGFAAGEPDFDTPRPDQAGREGDAMLDGADEVHAHAGRPRPGTRSPAS
jgi:aspartate/methionine/tyrosine aminotransferase